VVVEVVVEVSQVLEMVVDLDLMEILEILVVLIMEVPDPLQLNLQYHLYQLINLPIIPL